MHMQSYYIQYPPIYPSHTSSQKLIVASNNLVLGDIDFSKADEKSGKQDSKYLQPKWCPSGLSHTLKRRLQRLCKKKAIEQQVEAVLVKSTTMKKVWRWKQVVSTSTGIEQAMADNCYRP